MMYRLWLMLPIDKTDLISNPQSLRLITPASSSLLLTLKVPAISLDLVLGVALYLSAKRTTSPEKGRRVALAWFANPFNTIGFEMWTSLSVLATSLLALTLLSFARGRTLMSATLGAATFSVAPILALVSLVLCVHLGQTKRWKALLLQAGFTLVGLAAYVRWTSDLNLDPYRLLSKDTPYSFALADFQAEPYLYFGANIGIGTSLVLAYIICGHFLHLDEADDVIGTAYGAVAILIALSTWTLVVPLLMMPYLCLLMKDNFNRITQKIAILLMVLLPSWMILAGAPQLFRAGGSILFIPVTKGVSLTIQMLLENAATIFLLQPFVRGLLTATLLLISFAAIRFQLPKNV